MSTTADKTKPATIMVPVMTMEEVPILSEEERAELIASLKEAEAEIAAGKGVPFNPETFRDEMLTLYRAAKAKKGA
jgi:hypothetical protein